MSYSNKYILSNIDDSKRPGDSFYAYALGGWLRVNSIPDDYTRWGSFEIMNEENEKRLREIVEHPEQFANTSDAMLANKIAAFFQMGMDEDHINREGMAALHTEMDRVDKVATVEEVAREVARMHLRSSRPFFYLTPTEDLKNSSQVIAGLSQGGLGLPDRDYYLSDEARMKEIRTKYREHLVNMFALFGLDAEAARQAMETVMDIETELAKASTIREELRDPHKNYHKMTIIELDALSSGFGWGVYFEEIGLSSVGVVDVGQLDFFKRVGSLMQEKSLNALKVYLRWNVLRGLAAYAETRFEEEQFSFYGKTLSGQKVMKPRWKRVLSVVDEYVGQGVGKLYVAKHFSPAAKKRIVELVNNILVAMGERIERLAWMSPATKQAALKKLSTFDVKMGYPDVWIDYSSLEINEGSFLENVIRAHTFEVRRELRKVNKPADKTEWLMHPQMVNAYYNPTKNEIVFPAGILQAPFFSEHADDALNYGGIGAVIGHEITHGFDDQGRKFDAAGNLEDWWTDEDARGFEERSQVLVDQFNGFSPLPGEYVNGRLTLGENIADLGGLEISLDAFRKTEQYQKEEAIDGFTPLQRFFLSYAETWKTLIREEKTRMYLKVDPHSPAQFRVDGPLPHMTAFYEAFEVKDGQPMYRKPESRAQIW